MDFNLSETQSDVRELFTGFFESRSGSEAVRRAEPAGFDPEMWRALLDLGVLGMGLPPEMGGDGVGLGELMFAAEAAGRQLAPVPLVETLVATRLLARSGDSSARELLTPVLNGQRLLTFGLHPLRSGEPIAALPAGSVANEAVLLRDGELVVAELAGATPRPVIENLGSLPLADTEIAATRLTVATGTEAADMFARARDEWKILTAMSLIGLAARAFEIGLDYVKIRKAFGKLIGSFQTVGHKLADDVVQLDGARFLCYKAAWATDESTPDAAALTSMAFLYASETAARLTGNSLHLHGGVGFTMEHDIQLYYRRAKAWPLMLGDPRREYQVLADRLYGPRAAA